LRRGGERTGTEHASAIGEGKRWCILFHDTAIRRGMAAVNRSDLLEGEVRTTERERTKYFRYLGKGDTGSVVTPLLRTEEDGIKNREGIPDQ